LSAALGEGEGSRRGATVGWAVVACGRAAWAVLCGGKKRRKELGRIYIEREIEREEYYLEKNMDLKMSIVGFFIFRMRVCIYDHMWI
jgi:hypothetical protein